ncbi:MAG: hypothetical protein LBT96_02530 [Campylobacteraceae bacterium]|jgi:hypothetical protein|nr:hypothetical protein [Campylobacteraceae bacterium]
MQAAFISRLPLLCLRRAAAKSTVAVFAVKLTKLQRFDEILQIDLLRDICRKIPLCPRR